MNTTAIIAAKNSGGSKSGAIWFIQDTGAHYDAAGSVTRAFGHVSMITGGNIAATRATVQSFAVVKGAVKFQRLKEDFLTLSTGSSTR